jgi:isopenicillin-N epimerase
MPVAGPDQIVATIEAALDARTRLLVIDHIASPSAIVMPVERIVALARSRGVPVLVDGAHGPGMVDLNVDAIGADWYVGNCHKWLCAPKGAGFIAASPKPAFEVHPTVISHSYGLGFTAEFDKIGTRDPTAWLTVPDAIKFHERLGGAALRARNATLARDSARLTAEALGTECGAPSEMFGSMATIRLPGLPAERSVAASAHDFLWREHRIEAPVMVLGGALWLRISAQAYNEAADYAPLAAALHAAVRSLAKAA